MAREGGERLWGKSGSLRRAILLPVGVGALTFLSVATTILAAHGGSGAVATEHGIAIPVAAFATLLLMQMTVALWSAKRRIAAGRSPWSAFILIMGGFLVAGLTLIALSSGRDYRRALDLRSRGEVAQARVVRRIEEGCGKTACTTGLYYSFVPRGRPVAASGFIDETHRSSADNAEYDYALSTGTIPILYDPANPAVSMVFWRDSVERAASSFRISLFVWGGLLLALTVVEGFIVGLAVAALGDADTGRSY